MNLSSSTLKNRAKIKLQGLYGQSLVVSLIYTCIFSLCSGGSFVSVFRSGMSFGEHFASSGGSFEGEPFNINVSYSPFSSIGSLALTVMTLGFIASEIRKDAEGLFEEIVRE